MAVFPVGGGENRIEITFIRIKNDFVSISLKFFIKPIDIVC